MECSPPHRRRQVLEAFLVSMGDVPQSQEDRVKGDSIELCGLEFGAVIDIQRAKGECAAPWWAAAGWEG